MIVKFLKSTNEYIYERYKGLEGDFWINRGIAFISKDQSNENSFRTSLIDTISCENGILTVTTLNSTYVFEIIKGDIQDLDTSSIHQDRETFDKLKADAGKKSKLFICQVSGNAFIDNAISIVELPEEMYLNEAKEYIKNNILLDVSGEIVINIGAPYFPEE